MPVVLLHCVIKASCSTDDGHGAEPEGIELHQAACLGKVLYFRCQKPDIHVSISSFSIESIYDALTVLIIYVVMLRGEIMVRNNLCLAVRKEQTQEFHKVSFLISIISNYDNILHVETGQSYF
ncbi:MAG: hypothetical protein R6T98_13915 [Desulfatiglandales bacterium]